MTTSVVPLLPRKLLLAMQTGTLIVQKT